METLKGIFQCPQKLTNVIQTSQNSPWLSLRSLNKWYGVFAPQYYKFSQTFMGCYVLRKVAAPGCVHYGQRVFAECCSLGSVGVNHETEDSSVLAPGAQLGRYAFESCLTLATITFDMDCTNKPRALPEGAFCGAGIEQLCWPNDFHNIGPRACENCKSLVEVNLMSTEITALLSSTFAHCVALQCIWLPPRLMQIGKEAFRESLTHKLLTENQKLSCSKHLVSQVSQRPESKTKEKAGKRHAHFSPHT